MLTSRSSPVKRWAWSAKAAPAKTTLGRCITKLYEATGGEILLRSDHKVFDVTKIKGEDLRTFRRSAQTIFQDPYSSLEPAHEHP